MEIHIQWYGPFTYQEALGKRNELDDYGVYQIYGPHPVYGSDVLLYIGKSNMQTFGKRLSQENWRERVSDSICLTVYLGKLAGYGGTPTNDVWAEQINHAERFLIYSHWLAGNSSGLNVAFDENYHDIHIFNWGSYRDLLPEVSGKRYSNRFEVEGYECFVMQTPPNTD